MRTALILPLLWIGSLRPNSSEAQRLDSSLYNPVYSNREYWSKGCSIARSCGVRPLHVPAAAFGNAQDHRWEGVLVGGVGLGVVMTLARLTSCSSESTGRCAGATVAWGLAGGTVGAVLGGIIGGAIAKSPPDSAR